MTSRRKVQVCRSIDSIVAAFKTFPSKGAKNIHSAEDQKIPFSHIKCAQDSKFFPSVCQTLKLAFKYDLFDYGSHFIKCLPQYIILFCKLLTKPIHKSLKGLMIEVISTNVTKYHNFGNQLNKSFKHRSYIPCSLICYNSLLPANLKVTFNLHSL